MIVSNKANLLAYNHIVHNKDKLPIEGGRVTNSVNLVYLDKHEKL